MAPIDPGSDHRLARILGQLRREPAPSISMDAVLERWRRGRRRRAWLGAGISVAALVLLGFWMRKQSAPDQPPVHLELRVVDVVPDESGLPQDVLADLFGRPREVRGP
jgi:hypothetical protein